MANLILDSTKEKMEKAISHFSESLGTIRTGRANTTLVDHVEVDYYGSPTPVNQIASISVVEGKTLVIKPFDSSSLKNIEKACNAADLGIAPQNDGTVIRLTVPSLTEETRRNYVKQAKDMAEEARIALRNIRQDSNNWIKKQEFSENEEENYLEIVQKLIDKYNVIVEEKYKDKEKELTTV